MSLHKKYLSDKSYTQVNIEMDKEFKESIKQDLRQTEKNSTVCGMRAEGSWFSSIVQNFTQATFL